MLFLSLHSVKGVFVYRLKSQENTLVFVCNVVKCDSSSAAWIFLKSIFLKQRKGEQLMQGHVESVIEKKCYVQVSPGSNKSQEAAQVKKEEL